MNLSLNPQQQACFKKFAFERDVFAILWSLIPVRPSANNFSLFGDIWNRTHGKKNEKKVQNVWFEKLQAQIFWKN